MSAAVELRRAIRTGRFTGMTQGQAPGFVQANLMVLPAAHAGDFLRFCLRNPRPCPLLAVSEPGEPRLPTLADDLDLRTDLSSYRVFRAGEPARDVPDIADLWRRDLVAFALGCSFSFEQALLDAGLRLRHVEAGVVSAMYRTTIATRPAGPFGGGMIVSMRPFAPAEAIRAIQVTSRFPNVHGAPVHLGQPQAIGIDLQAPYGGRGHTEVAADELPLFWACGVTPQAAVERAKLPFAIAHTPGHMLVTDRRNAELAAL